jgi:hypothetical protein
MRSASAGDLEIAPVKYAEQQRIDPTIDVGVFSRHRKRKVPAARKNFNRLPDHHVAWPRLSAPLTIDQPLTGILVSQSSLAIV